MIQFGHSITKISKPDIIKNLTGATGMILFLSVAYIYIFAITGMICNIPISKGLFPSAFLLASVSTLCFTRAGIFVKAVAISIAIWVICIVIGACFPDFSSDGNNYHQEIIFHLVNGWNLIYEDIRHPEVSLWTIHYAKAIEIVAAGIVKFTGILESGKAVNLILMSATALICYSAIGAVMPTVSRRKMILLIIILIGNPVCITQVLTYYIDYTIYCYVLLTIASVIVICEKQRVLPGTIILIGTIFLAAGTKFNAFFIEGLTVLCISGWLWYRRNYKVLRLVLIVSFLSAVIGGCVLGFHPYLTNWINAGHPLYPLLGAGSVDIMTFNTPELYTGHNRFINFMLSIFGGLSMPNYDTRICGFGPTFSVLFLMAVIWWIYSIYRSRRITVRAYIVIVTLCSCFIFEQSWWARYIPQLWLLIPLTLMDCWESQKKGIKIFEWTFGSLAFVSILVYSVFALLLSIEYRQYRQTLYEVLEGKECRLYNCGPQNARHLQEHGINVQHVDSVALDNEYEVGFLINGLKSHKLILVSENQKRSIDSVYFNGPVIKTIHQVRKLTYKSY